MSDLHRNIIGLLPRGETSEVEFKSARGGMPGSLWESYSAFANTNGGAIVLGVQEKNGVFSLDGLSEDMAVQYMRNFWDCAHNRNKVSVCLPREEDVRIESVDGAFVLVCHIPRAPYNQRPVYLTTNPFGNTYRRNHEGDYLCTDAEVRRMFADADHERHPQDGRILKGYKLERDIDMETLHQYRTTFSLLQPTHPWAGISDMEFLKKLGAYTTDYETGEEGFTLAGVLMFGKYESITNNAGDPSFFLDYRERIGAASPETRWTHRIYPDGLWEANFYQFYIKVYNRLIQSLPRPFMIKGGIRQEETPAHVAVREALINCIIHSDLNAMGNIVVERRDDALVFRNPGMMLVSEEQYYTGGESICRNGHLQKMFMLLGTSEKAGSGVDKILEGWKFLGWKKPVITEHTRPDYVQLVLKVEKTDQEGVETDQENPIRNGETPQEERKRDKENHTRNAEPQQDSSDPTKKTQQEVAERDKEKGIKKKGQRKGEEKPLRERQIMEYCKTPKSLKEIQSYLGLRGSRNLRHTYLAPLLAEGTLRMTEPDKPTSRNQRYVAVTPDQD